MSYTAEELAALRAAGGDLTDAARVEATTDEEIERDLAADPDWKDTPHDWHERARLEIGIPRPWPRENKRPVTMRLDPDVLEHFKRSGRGWQGRINAVLRAYVESRQGAEPGAGSGEGLRRVSGTAHGADPASRALASRPWPPKRGGPTSQAIPETSAAAATPG